MDITGIGSIASLIQDGIDKIWPSKTDQQKAEAALLMTRVQGQIQNAQKQIEVNMAEAKNQSVFVSGARPFILWVCGGAFAWTYIGQPIAVFVAASLGHHFVVPALDMGELTPLMLGMLGLGGMDLHERLRGKRSK